MAEEKACEKCVYYSSGVCRLPIWDNGIYYPVSKIPEKGYCRMYEEGKENALPVE